MIHGKAVDLLCRDATRCLFDFVSHQRTMLFMFKRLLRNLFRSLSFLMAEILSWHVSLSVLDRDRHHWGFSHRSGQGCEGIDQLRCNFWLCCQAMQRSQGTSSYALKVLAYRVLFSNSSMCACEEELAFFRALIFMRVSSYSLLDWWAGAWVGQVVRCKIGDPAVSEPHKDILRLVWGISSRSLSCFTGCLTGATLQVHQPVQNLVLVASISDSFLDRFSQQNSDYWSVLKMISDCLLGPTHFLSFKRPALGPGFSCLHALTVIGESEIISSQM